MTEERYFPIHETRPDEKYIAGMLEHIEMTSQPETYQGVSTVKPHDMEGVVILSGEVKIYPPARPEQDMAPCPLCSPHAPKFMNGRIAWFPQEKTVQFIGHGCARRHMGEEFAVAESRFRNEAKARRVVAEWETYRDAVPQLLALGRQILPTVKAVDHARLILVHIPGGFSQMVQDEFNRDNFRVFEDGRAIRGTDGRLHHNRTLIGTVVGREFFAPGDNTAKLQRALRVLEGFSEPLQALQLGDDEGVKRIVERGAALRSALDAIKDVRDNVEAARLFLHPNNLALLVKWGALSSSPCTEFDFRRKGRWIFLDCESYHGISRETFDLGPDFDAVLPDVRYSILEAPRVMEAAE